MVQPVFKASAHENVKRRHNLNAEVEIASVETQSNVMMGSFAPALPAIAAVRALQSPRSVIIFKPKVRDEILAPHVSKCVLELHQLNKDVVLGIQAGSRLGRFEIK